MHQKYPLICFIKYTILQFLVFLFFIFQIWQMLLHFQYCLSSILINIISNVIKAILKKRFQSMLNLEWPDIYMQIWYCNDKYICKIFFCFGILKTGIFLQINISWSAFTMLITWQVSCLFPAKGGLKSLRTGVVSKIEVLRGRGR